MAEINHSHPSGKTKPHRKKLSTLVDLTPMVDLGFLLITFFIFTTSMSEPHSLKMKMPADPNPKDSSKTIESKTISLILGDHNTLWYYNGTALENVARSDYATGIRKLIQERKEAVRKKYGNANELVVLIKPKGTSTYNNLVRILDEMFINDVTRYILMEPSLQEIHTTAD